MLMSVNEEMSLSLFNSLSLNLNLSEFVEQNYTY